MKPKAAACPALPTLSDTQRAFVVATAVLCGAAVMLVEILGARVVGPWFGVSLFVWTSLITVTLLSLALGYDLGGRIADRRGTLTLLSCLVCGAGAWLLLTPWLRQPVLKASLGAGVRGGALVSSLVLFGPALTLLGMVTPFAVRLFLRDVARTGRTVGRLSALSTLGSFAGTVSTGFWIIPSFHVDQIAAGAAAILLLLGGCGIALSLRRPLALLLAVPPLFLLGSHPLSSTVLPSGTRAEVIYRTGSFYGQISVVDYTFPPRHNRDLLVDGTIQGGLDMLEGKSLYPYTYALERAALGLNPGAREALVIGLGPGTIPSQLARDGLRGTVVEIDPKICRVAERFFGFREGPFQLVVGDGRYFLESSEKRFDLVFLDAFSAETEPYHLFTQDAFRTVRSHLNPGGVLAINFSGLAPGPGVSNRALEAVIATLATIFPEVSAYHLRPGPPGTPLNFTLVGRNAGEGPPGPPRTFMAAPAAAESMLAGFFENRFQGRAGAPVFTDGWCPLEAWSAPVKLMWRRSEIEATPAAILLD